MIGMFVFVVMSSKQSGRGLVGVRSSELVMMVRGCVEETLKEKFWHRGGAVRDSVAG